jgi:cyclopropane-fatty-acyl-phospholipid synthase
MYRSIFFRVVAKIKHGGFTIVDEQGRKYSFGDSKPYFTVIVKDHRFYRRVVLRSDLGFGEAYMDGDIEIKGNLGMTYQLYLENKTEFGLLGKISTYHHSRNTKASQKSEIHHHYDIGNDFLNFG